MELNRKRSKVIMLPTKNKTNLLLNKYRFKEHHGNPLCYADLDNAIDRGFEYQHLYFTTDDEIKEGDWYIKNNTSLHQSACGEVQIGDYKNCKKIIATTNKDLGLPQPSEAFIQKYCELGGIDEVDIEYLRSSDGHYDEDDNWHWKLLAPKVDSHNTITIHPIKNSWNRDEVIELIKKYSKECTGQPWFTTDSKWIKENLK